RLLRIGVEREDGVVGDLIEAGRRVVDAGEVVAVGGVDRVLHALHAAGEQEVTVDPDRGVVAADRALDALVVLLPRLLLALGGGLVDERLGGVGVGHGDDGRAFDLLGAAVV